MWLDAPWSPATLGFQKGGPTFPPISECSLFWSHCLFSAGHLDIGIPRASFQCCGHFPNSSFYLIPCFCVHASPCACSFTLFPSSIAWNITVHSGFPVLDRSVIVSPVALTALVFLTSVLVGNASIVWEWLVCVSLPSLLLAPWEQGPRLMELCVISRWSVSLCGLDIH